jgi:hypothetical protein
MSYVVARFRDAPPWHPTSWVPPGVLRSPNPPSSDDEPPTSLGRGGLGILLGMLVILSTFLDRGERKTVGCRFVA